MRNRVKSAISETTRENFQEELVRHAELVRRFVEIDGQFKDGRDEDEGGDIRDQRQNYFEKINDERHRLIASISDARPIGPRLPFSVSNWQLEKYLISASDCILVEAPERDSVEAQNPPQNLCVKVRGSGCYWNFACSVSYGFTVVNPDGAINVGAESELTGLCDIGEGAHDKLFITMNGFVNQFRGVQLADNQEHGWSQEYLDAWVDGWQAHADDTWATDSGQDIIETEPGIRPLTPHGASINARTCNVRSGDVFILNYVTFITGINSGIDLSHNGKGTLIYRQPSVWAG